MKTKFLKRAETINRRRKRLSEDHPEDVIYEAKFKPLFSKEITVTDKLSTKNKSIASTSFNQYKMIDRLGSGAFGEVFKV